MPCALAPTTTEPLLAVVRLVLAPALVAGAGVAGATRVQAHGGVFGVNPLGPPTALRAGLDGHHDVQVDGEPWRGDVGGPAGLAGVEALAARLVDLVV